MTRARDVSRLITTPPNIYATDSESSAGFLSLSSASSIYQGAPFRNLIINGAMQVAQRSTSVASITADTYATTDRWRLLPSTQGTWTMSQENDAPTGSGFRKSTKVLCTTADASPAAGDYVRLDQRIEGQNLQHLKKGTASAQQLTLSFWVKSNVTGTYIARFYENDNNRNISKSYTINSSATWEYKTITFPADTTGPLDNDNEASLILIFMLGAGTDSTSGTLATTWQSYTAANAAVGQVNLASAISNYWQITGVQLEVGDTATPFEFKPFAQDLVECQRYYHKSTGVQYMGFGSGPGESGGWSNISVFLPATMRTFPTVSQSNLSSFNGSGSNSVTGIRSASMSVSGGTIQFFHAATNGQSIIIYSNATTSYVDFSAEL